MSPGWYPAVVGEEREAGVGSGLEQAEAVDVLVRLVRPVEDGEMRHGRKD